MRISDWSSDVCSSDLSRFGETPTIVATCLPPHSRPSAPSVEMPMPNANALNVIARPTCGVSTPAAWYMRMRTAPPVSTRSEEHTSELQSLMRISYAVFCLKKKKEKQNHSKPINQFAIPLRLQP